MDCAMPGSSVHGIFQARILEWVTIFFSRGCFQPRGPTQDIHNAGRFFTVRATRNHIYLPGESCTLLISLHLGVTALSLELLFHKARRLAVLMSLKLNTGLQTFALKESKETSSKFSSNLYS